MRNPIRRSIRGPGAAFLCSFLLLTCMLAALAVPSAASDYLPRAEDSTVTIPADTPIQLELLPVASAAPQAAAFGDLLVARVARDVEVAGQAVVEEGAEVLLLVVATATDQRPATLEATWVRAVDGTELALHGLYTWDGDGQRLVTAAPPSAGRESKALIAWVLEDFTVAPRPQVAEHYPSR